MTLDELNVYRKEGKIAPINGKDINFDFVEEKVNVEFNTVRGDNRFALYFHGWLIDVVNENDCIYIVSPASNDVVINFAEYLCKMINKDIDNNFQAKAIRFGHRVYFIYDNV